MRKIVLATAVAIAIAPAAWAGPKDKTSETLINPDAIAGSADWDNTAIATKVKSGKCKLQIQAKGATSLLNTPVICISEADVKATALGGGADFYGNSVVFAGAVSDKGKLKIKANLGSIGCGLLSTAINVNGSTKCYKEDIANYDAATECTNAGMLWVAPNLVDFKADGLVGLCQGLVAGSADRIIPPAAPLLAEQGSYQPLL